MRIIAAIIGVSAICFVIMCFFAGIFDTISVRIDDIGPYNLIYKEHKGPYKGVRFTVYDVYKYLTATRSIIPHRGFAVFYDNPRTTKQQDLKSIGGYITDKLIDSVYAPYATEVFAKAECIVGEFPVRSFMSPITGPLKFYPEMADVLLKEKRETRGSIMEIYDLPAKKIFYIAPLK